ncbi:MAG: MBL fold metallo-hydrolase [Planctomycetes bacterium]|nr:MBL fold metallo-hydrolase [Planctomycetota bacterium]MCB9920431.1 MBL fold metallo-hydrolase [Planctomycetota bacterium]
MKIQHFYDTRTGTISYVVADDASKIAVVIDPVMDYDSKAGRIFFESAEEVAAWIDAGGFRVPYALDTHPHADHMTAMPFFKERYGSKTVIGRGFVQVQENFADLFDLGPEFPRDGSQYDILLDDDEVLEVGPFDVRAISTPGHTPASMSFVIGDAVFVGDLLFQPDSGTARCDFPGGSSAEIYDSIQRIYALPSATRVFTLHDYQPGGRPLAFESTVDEQRRSNVHLRDGVSKEAFVKLRNTLEAGKPAPNLILPALQVNLRGGHLPEPASNGIRYLKIPLNQFGGA